MWSELEEELTLASQQISKLTKELAPVRNALQALGKREEAAPSALKTAESLGKIAQRIRDVTGRYGPLLSRLQDWTDCELLPASSDAFLSLVSSRVEISDHRLSGEINIEDSAKRSTSCAAVGKRCRNDLRGQKDDDTEQHHDRIEERQAMRNQQLRRRYMQRDIVEYLLRTERSETALAVARHYRIPLHYFGTTPMDDGEKQACEREEPLLRRAYPRLPDVASKSTVVSAPAAAPVPNKVIPDTAATSPISHVVRSAERIESLLEQVDQAMIVSGAANTSDLESIEKRPALSSTHPMSREVDRYCDLATQAKTLAVQLRCAQAIQRRSQGDASQCELVEFVARHILPFATVQPQLVSRVIAVVTTSTTRSDAHVSLGDVLGLADLVSEEGLQQLCERSNILSNQLSYFLRRREKTIRANAELRKPLPQLVSRIIAATIQCADDVADSVLQQQQQVELCRSDGGGGTTLFFDLARLTLLDMLRSVSPSLSSASSDSYHRDASTTAARDSLSPGSSAAWKRQIELRAQAFDELFTKYFSVKRRSQLVSCDEKEGKEEKREERTGSAEVDELFFALPNGYVIGKKSIDRLLCEGDAERSDSDGMKIRCPKTGEKFTMSQLKRIFLT